MKDADRKLQKMFARVRKHLGTSSLAFKVGGSGCQREAALKLPVGKTRIVSCKRCLRASTSIYAPPEFGLEVGQAVLMLRAHAREHLHASSLAARWAVAGASGEPP